MPSNPRIPRQFFILSCLFLLFLTVLGIVWFDPTDTIQATTSFVSLTFTGHASKCNLACPEDPFTMPGTLVFGPNSSDTRWVPFPSQPTLVEPLNSSDIEYDAPVSQHALDLACPQYMKMLANSNATSEMDWVQNKTVLFIGSSHDRNNVEFFCKEVGGAYSSIGPHTAGSCNVTSHNLVLAFWFIFGMVDSESYEWFSKYEQRPLTFEQKIQQTMLPWMAEQGIGNPDLIIETSLFWDESFFGQRAEHLKNAPRRSLPLSYVELAWHRIRLHTYVAFTRTLYGVNIPIMFRTRHLRESASRSRIRRLFQLDQNLRAVAPGLHVRLFAWGDLLEGESEFYDRDQHMPRGPVTWLFGDMVLFYLKQATTSGCWQCYDGQRY